MSSNRINATKDTMRNLLQRPIAFHRVFVQLSGSVTAGLMLSQAYYWVSRSTRPDHSFFKTREEWTEETGLTRYEQETARKVLAGLKTEDERFLWREERRGMEPALYFILDVDVLIEMICALTAVPATQDMDNFDIKDLNLPNGDKPTYRTAANPPQAMQQTPLPHGSKPAVVYTETTPEITTENTEERKTDPELLDQKGASSAVVSSLPSGANNKKPTAQANLIVPSSVLANEPQMAVGEYMPGLPDPRQQKRGIVATIDSYREQWRKLGFDEKRWQAYCKLLSDTCGLTALINAADDEVELNNVRRTAILLIKLGYGSVEQLKDLIEAYRKANEWKKTTPTLSALEKHASARNQQQTDGGDANGQTGQPTRIVIEFPNPVDIAMYPGVDPNTFTWHRQVITSRKEYEQFYLKTGVLHRVLSGYDANSAAK